MGRSVVQKLHNPRNRRCTCDPDCWCQRTAVGRSVRWWFPGRVFGLHHKGQWHSTEWKRQNDVPTEMVIRVVGVEPIFVVSDVPRAVAHYERLGFTTSQHDDGYAFAHRDDLTIHLARTDGERPPSGGSLYMHVNDADRLATDWREAGIEFVEPQDFDYGKREGSHTDPDGNLIRFGSPLRR